MGHHLDFVRDWREYTRMQLRKWGAAQREELKLELDDRGRPILNGWGRRTIEHVLREYGLRAPTGKGLKPESVPQEVIDCDRYVSALPEEMRFVMKTWYILKLSDRDGADALGKARMYYRTTHDVAVAMIAGRFQGG